MTVIACELFRFEAESSQLENLQYNRLKSVEFRKATNLFKLMPTKSTDKNIHSLFRVC